MPNSKTLEELLDNHKDNLDFLHKFRDLITSVKEYDLAKSIGEIKNLNFPETDTTSEVYKEARYLSSALNMAGIGVDIKMAHILMESSKRIIEKGGKFTISDAADIKRLHNELFKLDN